MPQGCYDNNHCCSMEFSLNSLTITPTHKMSKGSSRDSRPKAVTEYLRGDLLNEPVGYCALSPFSNNGRSGRGWEEGGTFFAAHNFNAGSVINANHAMHSPGDNYGDSENYEQYLGSILSEFGLAMSPDGTSIELDQSSVEHVDQSQLGFTEDFKYELERERSLTPVLLSGKDSDTDIATSPRSPKPITATTLPGSKFRKITEFANKTIQSQDIKTVPREKEGSQPPELPPLPDLEPLPTCSNDIEPRRKRTKKYERQEAFDDPEEERKRLNAINARKNRMKNKEQMKKLYNSKLNLEDVNQRCSLAIRRMTTDTQRLKNELEDKNRIKVELEQAFQEKENEIRKQKEKFSLFKGHLDLIAGSLDDDNPAKKLLSQFMKNINDDLR